MIKSICFELGSNLVGRWIPQGHMQAPVPLICHLEQWIQTQGFPLDTEKSVIASRRSVIHSMPPAQPAFRRLVPVHLEKPINLIVSPPVSPQPRNTTSGQTSNSATWYSYGQTSRTWSTAKIQEMLGVRLPRPSRIRSFSFLQLTDWWH